MKVGDLVDVYQYVARFEAGSVPTGKIGSGLVVETYGIGDKETLVSYVSTTGELRHVEVNTDAATNAIQTVINVVSEVERNK